MNIYIELYRYVVLTLLKLVTQIIGTASQLLFLPVVFLVSCSFIILSLELLLYVRLGYVSPCLDTGSVAF